MSARAATVTAMGCLTLTALLEAQLLRRLHAFDLFLSGPVAHPNPYRVGVTLGLPGLLLLLVGCVTLLGLVFSRAASSAGDRLLAGLALLPVAACIFVVHPFSSRAFAADRRHNTAVGIALLALSALALGALTLAELTRMRRNRVESPVDGAAARAE